MADELKPEELVKINHRPPLMKELGWMYTPPEIRSGIYCYAGKPANLEYVNMPNPREWSPLDEDWKLPENWKQIILEGQGGMHVDVIIDRFKRKNNIDVELKAASELAPVHEAQLLAYLRASGLRVGLLFNFGQKKLQTKRFVL